MTDQVLDELREKDRVVLQSIGEGRDDTQKITEATTLETHEVRYSLQKLHDLALVKITKPDGMVERVINGQMRVFNAPWKAELTDRARDYLNQVGEVDQGQHEDLSQTELAVRVIELEERVRELEEKLDVFREQVQRMM